MSEINFHQRRYPHFHASSGTYFITYRKAGSIVKHKLEEYKEIKKSLDALLNNNKTVIDDSSIISLIDKYNKIINESDSNLTALNEDDIVNVIIKTIHYPDGKEYNLISYCIMPNHVHLIFSLKPGNKGISKIMQSIKRISSVEINRISGKTGKFWQDESFDHIVRNENQLEHFVDYIKQNPVKAGMVKDWKDWKWTYVRDDYEFKDID